MSHLLGQCQPNTFLDLMKTPHLHAADAVNETSASSSSGGIHASEASARRWFASFTIPDVLHMLQIPSESPWRNRVVLLRPAEYPSSSERDITPERLNVHFRFVAAYTSIDSLASAFPVPDERRVIVVPQCLRDLLHSFNHFSADGMRTIIEASGCQVAASAKKEQVQRLLSRLHPPRAPLVFLFQVGRARLFAGGKPPAPAEKDRKRKARQTEDASETKRRREKDAASHRDRYDESKDARLHDAHVTGEAFPRLCSDTLKHSIISDFQKAMHPSQFIQHPCGVCQTVCYPNDVHVVEADQINFGILVNPAIPQDLLPTSYNLQVYKDAILYPPGMHSLDTLGPVNMCTPCYNSLVEADEPHMPEFALANDYYFAYERLPSDVKFAFENASVSDLTMVSLCRASRITFRFTADPSRGFAIDPSTAQGYSKGNTIILPQDPSAVRRLLPPSFNEINEAVCALFVGKSKPTMENIAKLSPIMVSKSIVRTLLDFLLKENSYYRASGTQFSQDNLDSLFSAEDKEKDTAVPRAVEIGFTTLSEAVRSSTADYTDRNFSLERQDDDGTEDLLMESVGYTNGDHTPQNYLQMKAQALSWCRGGKPFIKYQASSKPMADYDEAFLTSVFPHLDPWGLCALNHPHRRTKTSLLRQVQHLVKLHKSPFEKDANFAYICWNVIAKAEVNRTLSFRVKERHRQRVASEISSIPPNVFASLAQKLESNPSIKPSTPDEKKALHILTKLRHVTGNLKGSAGSKLHQRNEVRGLINVEGTPALFTTINPSDVRHPLVRVLVGNDPRALQFIEKGDKRLQAQLVADHPAAAAIFFDVMITSFIRHVLRFGKGEGLFGICTAYYGTVEAQGKGTLHLHLLIWLKGNLNPQALRDRMASDPEYEKRMIAWLEENIRTALPDASQPVTDPSVPKPIRSREKPHPSSVYGPQIADYKDLGKFDNDFLEYVSDMACECNWHIHTDTCWKKLKKSEPRDDEHCRMGINGTTRLNSYIDEETGSIVLRRWHPRINNYQVVVIGLIQGNMDIKYIGSGEGAKATVYYFTDYVTKTVLPVHIGLAALTYAIERNELKFDGQAGVDQGLKEKSLLTKSVNAMMSRTELSHQQVMSFIIGGGDHYTSHKFQILYWGYFDRWVRKRDNNCDSFRNTEIPVYRHEASEEHATNAQDCSESLLAESDDAENLIDTEPEVILSLTENSVTASNQIYDYRLRPSNSPFLTMSLWEFVAGVVKISKPYDEARQAKRNENTAGRKPLDRGTYSTLGVEMHPQADTHMFRKRDVPLVPVLLGPSVSRPDKNLESREEWCRAMLILFKPWRQVRDIRDPNQSWSDAFDHFDFPENLRLVMHNMNVLNECKDARITHDILRREGRAPNIYVPAIEDGGPDLTAMNGDLESALLQDEALDGDSDVDETEDTLTSTANEESSSDKEVRNAMTIMANAYDQVSPVYTQVEGCTPFSEAIDSDISDIKLYERQMKYLKKSGKPNASKQVDNESELPRVQGGLNLNLENGVKVTLESLGDYTVTHLTIRETDAMRCNPLEEIERIVDECGLRGNEEQERAFRIVAEHFVTGRSNQLLMYLGGVGGTGKSHVINAIVKIFQRCGFSQSLLLSAPTGIAAVLISGYTIHSLTLLPKSAHRPDIQTLSQIWGTVQWLVLDEISMVSAKLLSQISHQISIAKGLSPDTEGRPFGGVNIIFSGDFGQLRPVRQQPLFSHDLVSRVSINTAQTITGQTALHGAYLWRQIDTVVQLRKNLRHQTDPRYSNLLQRVRFGKAWQGLSPHTPEQIGSGDNYNISDYRVLLNRSLDHLRRSGVCLDKFHDAPFIVTRKRIRDRLNTMKVQQYATGTDQTVEYFEANDFVGKRRVTSMERKRLLRVSSSTTNDALGILPLVPGMKIMITENIALAQSVVNGAEGVLLNVKYRLTEEGGKIAVCALVKIPGSGTCVDPTLGPDVYPIVPTRTHFKYSSTSEGEFTITRWQLPLLPAYAYTDYKSQGRTLEKAIVDLAECHSLQSLYVMLSRVRSIEGLAILRWFKPTKLYQNLQAEFRREFERLEALNAKTTEAFENRTALSEINLSMAVANQYQLYRKHASSKEAA